MSVCFAFDEVINRKRDIDPWM